LSVNLEAICHRPRAIIKQIHVVDDNEQRTVEHQMKIVQKWTTDDLTVAFCPPNREFEQ
jgi:hypothetical protein